MDIGPYVIALIGVGGIIVGALLGAWIGFRLSVSLARIKEIERAKRRLREAFKTELLALSPSQHALGEDLPQFLERSFKKHREAIFDYSLYLKPKDKRELYKAWYAYYCIEEDQSETSIPFFEQYSFRGLTITQRQQLIIKAKRRLEKILETAKIN
jgi:hypothetical protein